MQKDNSSRNKIITALLVLVIIVLIVAIVLTQCVATKLVIEGNSMFPTYRPDEVVWIKKTYSKIQRGDIVVYKSPEEKNKKVIKRVVAIAGDTLEFKNSKLLINGKEVDEPYRKKPFSLPDGVPDILTKYQNNKIPANSFFAIGDNQEHSRDCLEYGPVSYDQIVGKVIKNKI